MSGKIKCPKCGRAEVRHRMRTKDYVCRICGHIWKEKTGKIYVNYTPNCDLTFNFAKEILDYYGIDYSTELPEEVKEELKEKGVLYYHNFYKTWLFNEQELDKASITKENKNIVLFTDDSDTQHYLITTDEGIKILTDFLNLK